jgi:general secretion pathway protein A
MYTRFFGLNEKPFSITPDPRYLFMSARHGEALAHLVYAVTESGGFMQLTGEVGTGKTTLVRTLLLNRMPANANVAVVLNPQLSALEFLVTICEELHVPVPDDRHSIKALIDTLNGYLLEAHADGRRTILVVDEAQNLAPDVLEQVRLLTNLETAKQKLLQIVLIGQPELRELLARNDLRQLAQRITGRYHLEPLSREETEQYIEHRLKVAGALGEVFDTGAKRQVFRLTQGVPRLINVICDRALLGAFSIESRRVNRRIIRRAATEITGKADTANTLRRALPVVGIIAAVVISAGFLSLLEERKPTIDATIEAAVPAIQEPADIAPASEPEPEPEPVAEEAQVSLDDQLQLAQELTSPQSAMAALLNLWGFEYRGGDQSGCAQAEAAGYSCLGQRGSWGNLKQFDRPAVLTLVDARGQTHNVVLSRIEGQTVELSIGGVVVTHPIGEVSDMWLGQYMLLWRPPNGAAVSMAPGSRGPSVFWLRKSLAEIDARYRTDLPDSDEFDEDLRQNVRAFQREHRLAVDGVAGQQTQIIINTLLAADDTPRLTIPRLAQD